MLSNREIVSVLEMLQNVHLDVRAVTLGINLFDCASHDLEKLKENITRKIHYMAKDFVNICERVG